MVVTLVHSEVYVFNVALFHGVDFVEDSFEAHVGVGGVDVGTASGRCDVFQRAFVQAGDDGVAGVVFLELLASRPDGNRHALGASDTDGVDDETFLGEFGGGHGALGEVVFTVGGHEDNP